MPLVIRHTVCQAAFPSFEPLDDDELEELHPSTRGFFQRSTEELGLIGFSLVARAVQDQQVPGVTACVLMFRKVPEQDWPIVTHIVAESQSARKEASYVEFSTSFIDGSIIDTNNSSELPGFDADPAKRQFQLPHVRDAVRLYRIHAALVSGLESAAKRGDVPDDRAPSTLAEDMQRDFRVQEANGLFHLDPAEMVYRPTLAGAYRLAWRQLWPVSTIRRMVRAVRARRLDGSVPP